MMEKVGFNPDRIAIFGGSNSGNLNNSAKLEIPEVIDQRFFLHDMEEFKVHLLQRALS